MTIYLHIGNYYTKNHSISAEDHAAIIYIIMHTYVVFTCTCLQCIDRLALDEYTPFTLEAMMVYVPASSGTRDEMVRVVEDPSELIEYLD